MKPRSHIVKYCEQLVSNDEELTQLSLTLGDLKREDAPVLADALKTNNTVKTLYLYGNYLGSSVSVLLASLYTHPSLDVLHLACNGLEEEETVQVAELLRRNRLVKTLSLRANKIGDRGCSMICDALQDHPSLLFLDLSINDITSDAAPSLAALIRNNRVLEVLSLGNNKLGDVVHVAIADALKSNFWLKNLYLSWTGVTDVGAVALADALRINDTLKWLYVDGNYAIGEKGQTTLVAALEKNRSIVGLGCNMSSELTGKMKAFIQRNKDLAALRRVYCRSATATLLGIRKLRNAQAGLLRNFPRDCLRFVLAPIIFATRSRVDWDGGSDGGTVYE